MTRHVLLALGFIVAALWASNSDAQGVSPISFEASVGVGKGWSGAEYVSDGSGLSFDALLGLRLRSLEHGGLVAGLSGGIQGGGTSTTICTPGPSGDCIPAFPDVYMVSALTGWESGRGILRVMLGPAFAHASGAGNSFGVQGRVDAAAPFTDRIALVASFRPTVIPDFRESTMKLLAFGIGLRLR
jgi:hypothetical protein